MKYDLKLNLKIDNATNYDFNETGSALYDKNLLFFISQYSLKYYGSY